ncbi:glutamyl-tRNA synthetase [Novosphingobium nitrogenifigens DSM 19370]|uniref:Glutamyl-tRNA synthetase n=1 Tax=Novosphingobium nitrogenifigens DSM 19370 TaxID=983920 RepID=F1Z6M6_9SPHN|nr:HIG1 domain-containing protein [Novosphingobium nitrogenifigens]EGD59686.1 glutamyl-tRNA synthetase [Novosphingobium nitrogenifigens DSM 19370]
MIYVLAPVLLVLMGLTVWSLARGIAAFMRTTREGIEKGDGALREMQLLQNRMMMNRIKFQGLAVVVVAILLAMAGHK